MILVDWLEKIHSLHIKDMDLSLERVKEVAGQIVKKPSARVITVGGTNGKGSCVAALEAIYKEAGYRVGVFTSPILFRHNEYIRIQGIDVSDEELCEAFEYVEKARGNISLTSFEYTTLAAFFIFQKMNLDVWILEVGLGGRFDAVNSIDSDTAIIASISMDHMEWLGDTREKIAYEKAGILRKDKPAICGDSDVPQSLLAYANEISAPLFCQNIQFGFTKQNHHSWSWWSNRKALTNLPFTNLALQNIASVLMAIELMQDKLPVERNAIDEGIKKIKLLARIQVVPGDILQIYDVSHNPAAAALLANWLKENFCQGKTRAVFSMLGDKDILSTLKVIQHEIDEWFIAELPVKRGASELLLENNFKQADIICYHIFSSIEDAYEKAMHSSKQDDRVVVFGSFHTVANVLTSKSACATLNARAVIST